jgi:hypothetical protein
MDNKRLIGWVVPCLCIAGAGAVVFTQHRKLQEAETQLRLAQAKVEEATKAREALERNSAEVRFAAATQSPYEEAAFLNEIRQRAIRCGVVISRWDSRNRAFGDSAEEQASTDPKELERQEKLKGITRISSDLTLIGPYSGIRKFLGETTAQERLYTLSNARWRRRDEGGTELLVTVSRYVEPPQPEAAVTFTPETTGDEVK